MALSMETIKWLQGRLGNRVRIDEPMALHTSFKVGGPADALVMPKSIEELEAVTRGASQRDIPLTIMGGGTNLLVGDRGITGIVIAMTAYFSGIRILSENRRKVQVSVLSGTRTKTLCRFALDHGWRGLNFLMGIPGSVGGGIAMNAGTSDGCMAEVVSSLKIMDLSGNIEETGREGLAFSYRRFGIKPKPNLHPRERLSGEPLVILEGCFSLTPADKARLKQQATEILHRRRKKQPISVPSAGSFFKNPRGGKPAGMLIEQAGLKGRRIGDAEVSGLHGNFIVNTGRATARDILQLMALVQKTVSARFNIDLEPEVKIIGN